MHTSIYKVCNINETRSQEPKFVRVHYKTIKDVNQKTQAEYNWLKQYKMKCNAMSFFTKMSFNKNLYVELIVSVI